MTLYGIDYPARVAKGVAHLDTERPDWLDVLDLDTLDIASNNHCVTAQLSGEQSWRVGMDQLGLTGGNHGSYIAHGFNAEDPQGWGDRPAGYYQQGVYFYLNQLWHDVITARREAASQDTAAETE